TAAPSFPKLEILDPSTPHTFIRPAKRINDGDDVSHFLTSKAYRDIGIFIMQLNRALCPRKKPSTKPPPTTTTTPALARANAAAAVQTFTLTSPRRDPEPVKALHEILRKLAAIIDEAPPDPGPRRFGNVSFRKWHALMEERADELLRQFLSKPVLKFGQQQQQQEATAETADDEGKEGAGPLDELKAYFLGSFGSAQRLDFGTGHELSFVAFLGCLWKLGAFEIKSGEGDLERSIVLGVIEPYLNVIRRLILTYTLEPAGSHGVWGLDDHFFLSYIFGSAQLTRPITETEPMPLEGSLAGASKPSDVVKAAAVESRRADNMYFSAIGFINDVKKGPFWEHSPILFDISGIKDGWGKINKGMIKMFNAEVLSKFPVVQHFVFGSLFSWDADPNAAAPLQSVHMVNQPIASGAGAGAGAPAPSAAEGTTAPWAQATRMPGGGGGAGIPYSRVP
ncbi:Phosphotyrosyl phosphatase activator, partial [Bombardia bombarda]